MEGLFQLSAFEEFLLMLGFIQFFVTVIQFICSIVRWEKYKLTQLRQRIIIYWVFLCLYIIAVLSSLLFFQWRFMEYLYFSYWLVWFYYCVAVTLEVNKEKIIEIIKWGF
jgi:hypothetical protein